MNPISLRNLLSWVLDKEFSLSLNLNSNNKDNNETILITIDPYYGSLIPQQEPSFCCQDLKLAATVTFSEDTDVTLTSGEET